LTRSWRTGTKRTNKKDIQPNFRLTKTGKSNKYSICLIERE